MMNIMEDNILKYLMGINLKILDPTITLKLVIMENASITPIRTSVGLLKDAAKSIEDSCVLSPNSINEISVKLFRNDALTSLNSHEESFELLSESKPKIMKVKPATIPIKSFGRMLKMLPPRNALKPSTMKNASIAPEKTEMKEDFEARIIVQICVLSPNSANRITVKDAMRGAKSIYINFE